MKYKYANILALQFGTTYKIQMESVVAHNVSQYSSASKINMWGSDQSYLVVTRPVPDDDTLILRLIGGTDFLLLLLLLLLSQLRGGVLGGDGGGQVVALRLEAVLASRVHHRVGDAVGSRVAELARHAVAVVILWLARLRHRDAVLSLETDGRNRTVTRAAGKTRCVVYDSLSQ